jgi:acyl-CoA synthetase (AMP-forming)/AMP-acid ligase II/peptidoglycan/LPS O-acetylase OafA/YrhL
MSVVAAPRGPCFAARLRQFGEQPAIVTEGGHSLSYAALADRVEAMVAELGPTRRLLLVEAANEIEPLTAWLAGLAGGHAVLITAEASEAVLAKFRPDARFRNGPQGYRLELDQPEGGLHPDLALLLSTSGSTGATKLVRLSTAAVEANAASIAQYLGLGPGSRALTTLPMHYSYGLSVVNSHLLSGGTLLLTARSLTEPEIWRFFEAEGGTSFAGVPYSFELLDRTGFWARAPRTLETITQAGGRLPPEAVSRIGDWAEAHKVRFFVMYGQTEATARIAYLPPDQRRAAPDCIGVAIPGGTLTLRGPDGETVEAAGVEGELVYRGPNVMMGYALEREDLAHGPELEALATGDLAVRTEGGLFRIVGRASRIAKPFGLRVSLDELESILAAEGVRAAVTGNDDVIAVAVAGVAPADLAARLAARLKLPESLFDVTGHAELPRLPNGKTDYRSLLDAAVARRAAQAADAAGQDPVTAAFARIFPSRRITPESSFNELGGDSLSYVQMSLELETALGDLPDGWERMPVAALAARAGGTPSRRSSWLVRVPTDVVLRAIAILAVLINHMSGYQTGGGSDVLMILVGYSLARFQSDRLISGGGPTILAELVTRVMLPYLAILALYALVRKPVPIENFLLLGNLTGPEQGFLQPFWFLDVLFQLYLMFVLLFMLPRVRALAATDPFRLGVALVAAGFALKLGGLLLFDHVQSHLNRTPDAVFLLVAIGWSLWFAERSGQRALLVAASAALAVLTAGLVPALDVWKGFPLIVGELRALWLIGTVLLLLFVPRLPLPRLVSDATVRISASAYYIYLTHGLVVYLLTETVPGLGLPQLPLPVWLAIACLLGIALNAVVARVASLRRPS